MKYWLLDNILRSSHSHVVACEGFWYPFVHKIGLLEVSFIHDCMTCTYINLFGFWNFVAVQFKFNIDIWRLELLNEICFTYAGGGVNLLFVSFKRKKNNIRGSFPFLLGSF